MHKFWDNITKFPVFFLSVLLGFFSITFNTLIELLKFNTIRIKVIIVLLGMIIIINNILKLMLGLN